MFNKKTIIEVDNAIVIKHEVTEGYFKLKFKSENYNLSNLEDMHIDLKNRATSIILLGEELSVKSLTLPKSKKETIQLLIRDELFYSFKSLENMAFAYSINKQDKSSINAFVFCMDISKVNYIQTALKRSSRIKGVKPIQVCLLKFIRSQIEDKNYALVFTYRHHIYFLYCINGIMLHNRVYDRTENEMEVTSMFNIFLENCRILSEESINKIYIANCSNILSERVYEHISCVNLGFIDEKYILRSLGR